MEIKHRVKYEMFVRVRNFGVVHRGVFPEASAGGKLFARLAVLVASIEEELVRRAQARADARKLNRGPRDAARRAMKVIAATGRRAALGETTPHSFRMPTRKAATVILSTARLLKEEAERRKDRFVELGMPPTFIADYDAVVDELAKAVAVQQDSRAARRRAGEALAKALGDGMSIAADLDVTVPNALGADRVGIAEWTGARRIDTAQGTTHAPAASVEKANTAGTPEPAAPDQPALKIAS